MKTQEQRILQVLKEAQYGIHPTYFPATMGILQYGRAINNLRKEFGCSCKNGNTACFATEHIINKKLHNGTTIFFYKKDTASKNQEYTQWVEKKKAENKSAFPYFKESMSLFDGL